GQLGTVSSSERFKTDIVSMDRASESVMALKPVTFHYKSDSKGTAQFGLIAEEVAKVNPDLVVRDDKGEIYTVRYDAANAMLLNEFLKEHHKVQELNAVAATQEVTITQQQSTVSALKTALSQQQKQIEALTAGLQKVTARIDASNAAARVVSDQ